MTDLEAARKSRRAGDYRRALELLAAPDDAEGWRLRADVEEECGLDDAARRSRARFEKLALAAPGRAESAARALDSYGRYDAALKLYLAAAKAAPAAADGPLLRAAELSAWLGRYAQARRLAESVSRRAPSLAAAWRVRASAEEDDAAALNLLARALDLDPGDVEARVWRAERLRRLGRRDDAAFELERALAASRGFGEPVGAFLNRMLLAAAAARAVKLADRERLLGLGIAGASRELADVPLAAAVARRVERALESMKGNRSRLSTRVVRRRLERFEAADPRGPGGEYARIQRYCLLGEPEKAVASFDRIEKSGKALPRLFAYRGEVRLWQGLYKEAIADFEEALRRDPSLPWPRIGKAGALTLLGEPGAALESLAEAARVASPERLWIRRAEARLRSGDARAALEDLSQITSGRKLVPSAWLLEALADPGRRGERLAQLERGCAGFVEAAKAELGPDGGDGEALLERCLAMMRGNRSLAGIGTYVLASGEMRALPVDDEAAFAYRR